MEKILVCLLMILREREHNPTTLDLQREEVGDGTTNQKDG